MKNVLVTIAVTLLSLPPAEAAYSVSGPDGRLVVTTDVADGGVPVYSVSYDGLTVLEQSPLGFVSADVGDFSCGMTAGEAVAGVIDRVYSQDKIKCSEIHYRANTLEVPYRSADGRRMSVEWRVSDNDIAFRYLIPRQGKKKTGAMVVERETTGYRFPQGTTTFLTPQSDAMIAWKRTKPSYEEYYVTDAPMDSASQYGHGYTFPCLFKVGDAGWVLLTETGVDGYYCGSHLSDWHDGLYTIAYPMPEENNGNGTASPGIALPGATPWRTITVGSTLAPVVETTVPWDVVEPRYDVQHQARPGRGTWSWIIWQDESINYDDQRTYIDFAAEMGYENVLIDNWWDCNIGRERMAELAQYAASKGVNLILWYSSSGHWNDIEQSPINIMDRPIPRKKEMKWLRDIGVSSIKVDFFGGDKQETMRLYEDILSDAADYGIDVVFHGCTMPRGWERMYPNYVGSEAVLASENLVFDQRFCDLEAFHATLHPFMRNAAGIMEYGGTVLNKRLHRSPDKGNVRRTGDAFQLATSVLFQNPVQNFALTPDNLTDAPADAIGFMKEVPTTWDETRLIDGYPGRYVVLARRHGHQWYIAGVNATGATLELKLDLPMLDKGAGVTVYADRRGKELKSETLKVKNPSAVPVSILPGGGVVIVAR